MSKKSNSARKLLRTARDVLVTLWLLPACVLAGAQQPSGPKAIQDKAESDAYTAAIGNQSPSERAEALEAFVKQYPQSVVLIDALEQEMAAWQAAGDSAQVKRVAKQLWAADSSNVRVLGIIVALDRVSAMQGDTASLNEMCEYASGGVNAVPMWRKPANMSDEQFAALGKLMKGIFIGAEGFCAVQQKNYSQGRDWLTRALQLDPGNVQDTYQLAIADLEMTPQDPNGIWYCARAVQLARTATFPQDANTMLAYCKAKYKQVHGSDDGWDSIVAAVALQDAPPGDFAKQVKPAPAKQ